MNKRARLLLLAVLGLAGLLGWPYRPHLGPPNILLITVDTLRADALSCTGATRCRTPSMDALAARGALFLRAYAQCDRTVQSHISILTSRYLSQIFAQPADSPTFPTLAEILKSRGYRTAAIPSVSLLDPGFALDTRPRLLEFGLGFDDFYPVARAHRETEPGETFTHLSRSGEETNALAFSWLRARSAAIQRRPWFLWIHYYDCHAPYQPPPDLLPSDDAARHDGAVQYFACVAHADRLIGALLEELDRDQLARDTAVVLTGDHGESLGEHELLWAHSGLYEPILRVPLIIAMPGGPHGVRRDDLAENLDILPTLLGHGTYAFAGIDLLRDPPRTLAFAETRNREGRMVTDGHWKYSEYLFNLTEPAPLDPHQPPALPWFARRDPEDASRAIYRPAGLEETFDLRADPHELHDLHGTPSPAAEVAGRMQHLLADKFRIDPRHQKLMDPELLRRLKALNY